MTNATNENSIGHGAGRGADRASAGANRGGVPGAAGNSMSTRIIGSLKDALLAAGRDDATAPAVALANNAKANSAKAATPLPPPLGTSEAKKSDVSSNDKPPMSPSEEAKVVTPSAEEAARIARGDGAPKRIDAPRPAADVFADGPPTTRVMRPDRSDKDKAAKDRAQAVEEVEQTAQADRTVLVRGKQAIDRSKFERDPVVGFLVVVGGPGLGAFRPVFEGNNTIGRSSANRIALDFGDDTISSEQQAYIRYDSNDRSFLFVPNLAKTNVVSVNNQRPTSAVPLTAMDVLTFGRTQVAFVPFCGDEFDWAEIAEA